MSKRWERADVRLATDIDSQSESLPLGEDTPFIIAVLGDFTGRSARDKVGDAEPLAARTLIEIDRDNFDAVMERLDVRFETSLNIPSAQAGERPSAKLLMRGIESFHPDEIVTQVEPLRALLDLRRALADPAKFDAAAREIRNWITVPDDATSSPRSNPPSNLLEAILEEANPSAAVTRGKDRPAEIDLLVQEIVRPHVIRLDVARQQELIAAVEKALGEQVKTILHHRDFQQLEAAWRSLHFLVMNAETGPQLKIYLLDVSKAELKPIWLTQRKSRTRTSSRDFPH
jgi:type VI secretion system ImpB/VipA family protein